MLTWPPPFSLGNPFASLSPLHLICKAGLMILASEAWGRRGDQREGRQPSQAFPALI